MIACFHHKRDRVLAKERVLGIVEMPPPKWATLDPAAKAQQNLFLLYAPATSAVKEICVDRREPVAAHDLLPVIG